MELTATIKAVLPIVTGASAKGEWKKATVVVSYMDGQYEQSLALENMRNAEAFVALPIGQTMKFYFNVTSREHNGKWYTSATCWKWEPMAGAMPPQPTVMPQQQAGMPQQPQGFNIPGQPMPF